MRANLLKTCLAAFAIIILIKIGFFPALLLFITMGVVPIINLELEPMVMLALQGTFLALLSFFIGYQVASNISKIKRYQTAVSPETPPIKHTPLKRPALNLKQKLITQLVNLQRFYKLQQAKTRKTARQVLKTSQTFAKQVWEMLKKLRHHLQKVVAHNWPHLKNFIQRLPKHAAAALKVFYSSVERTVAWFRHN